MRRLEWMALLVVFTSTEPCCILSHSQAIGPMASVVNLWSLERYLLYDLADLGISHETDSFHFGG